MHIFMLDPSLFSIPYDRELCRALSEAGARVTLIGRPLRRHERLGDEPFALRPLFYPLSEGRLRGLGALSRALKGAEHALGWRAVARAVARERPDILHLQWLALARVDAWGLGRLKGRLPLVHSVHNSVPFHGGKALQRGGWEGALRAFDGYIGHTEQTGRFIADLGVAPERMRVLRHPPLPLPELARAARPDGQVELLFFGTIKAYKGVDVLVRAALMLAGRRRDFHVTIAGQPFIDLAPLREEVRAAGAADLVAFDGRFLPDDDLARLVAAADVVVFPYRDIDASGAFTVAVEAEKPIIATALGVFTEPPSAGRLRLVPPDDAGALADAMEELVADPGRRASLAAATAAIRRDQGSWSDFARASLDFYEALLTGAPSR